MKYRKSAVRELSEISGVNISKKSEVEKLDKIIYVDKVPLFFYYEKLIVPTLHCLKNHKILPFITVDDGAIKFLIKGADMMRPGIIAFDEFFNNSLVAIKGKNSDIPLGIGLSLFSSSDAEKLNSGKIIKVIHYSGDKIWKTRLN